MQCTILRLVIIVGAFFIAAAITGIIPTDKDAASPCRHKVQSKRLIDDSLVFDVTSLLPLKSKVMQMLMHSPLNKHCFYISLTFFTCCSKCAAQNFCFRYQKMHLPNKHFFDTTAFPYDFPLSGSPTRRFSKCSEKYKKTADFSRNQRLNMVAGTGLEPAASGL